MKKTIYRGGKSAPVRAGASRTSRVTRPVEALEHRTLLSAGQLDPAFGSGGKVLLPSAYGNRGAIDAVNAPAGALVTLGTNQPIGSPIHFLLTRYAASGAVDTTFGTGGSVDVGFAADHLIAEPNGSLVVAGYGALNGVKGFELARYTAAGKLDTTFGSGGHVVAPILPNVNGGGQVDAMAQQPGNGVIAVVGNGDALYDVAVFTANGAIDTAFNGSGEVSIARSYPNDTASNAVLVQSDGKVVVGGQVEHYQSSSYATASSVLVRYKTNGAQDPGFGVGGNVYTAGIIVRDLAMQPGGRLLALASNSTPASAVYGFTSAGALDPTFGAGGFRNLPATGRTAYRSLAVAPDGRVVVGGANVPSPVTEPDQDTFYIARLTASGSLDPTFGNGGLVETRYTPVTDDRLFCVVVRADAKIVAVGMGDSLIDHTSSAIEIARYNVNGSLDSSFGAGGKLPVDFGDFASAFNAVTVQTDGKVLVAGSVDLGSTIDFYVARYNVNGTPDVTFGMGGYALIDFGGIDAADRIVLQADGKILLGGNTRSFAAPFGTDYALAIARLNANGTPDTTFGVGGKVTLHLTGADGLTGLALAPGGKLVASVGIPEDAFGFGGGYFRAVRFNGNGTLDTTFAAGGVFTYNGFSANALAESVAVRPDGEILLGGSAKFNDTYGSTRMVVVAVKPSGAVDTSFGTAGVGSSGIGDYQGVAQDVLLQPNGGIVLTGHVFEESQYIDTEGLARLNPDGSTDSDFGAGGLLIVDNGSQKNPDLAAVHATLQSDGRIILLGSIELNIQTEPVVPLVMRYLADGRPDPTFGVNGRVLTDFGTGAPNDSNLTATGIAVAPDGRIVLVCSGAFSKPGAMYRVPGNVIARFLPGGPDVGSASLDSQGTLTVNGTSASDTITITRDATGVIHAVVNGHQVGAFTASLVKLIDAYGSFGNDSISVNAGNIPAELSGEAGNDTLTGGAGANTLRGGAGNDTLRPGFSASNWVEGDGGTDIVDYSNRTKGVEVHLDGMVDSGYSGEHDRIGTDVEIVYGGSGNDIIFGNVGSPGVKNALYGNGGNDTLIAGNGSDALFGGEGNDLLLARNGVGDYLDGGNGTDAVHIDMGLDKTINVETFLP